MGNEKGKNLAKNTEKLFTQTNLEDKKVEQDKQIKEDVLYNNMYGETANISPLVNLRNAGVFNPEGDVIKTNDFGSHSIDKELEITPYTSQEDIDRMRDEAQGFWGVTANTVAGVISKTMPKLAEQVAGLGVDLENYNSEGNQTAVEFIEKARAWSQAADEAFPIYGSADEDKGTWGNPEWVAKNMVSETVPYALGAMIAGMGIGGVAALAESALIRTALTSGNAVVKLGQIVEGGQMLAQIQKAKSITNGISTLGQAFAMTELEGRLIGYDVAKDTYAKKQQEYLDSWKIQYARQNNIDPDNISDAQIPEEVKAQSKVFANDVASNAGTTANNINRFSFALNLTGLKYFTAAEKSTEMAVKRTFLNAAKELGIETLEEGAEELIGGVAETLAKKQAERNLTLKTGGGAFGKHDDLGYDVFNHIFSKQGVEEFLGGAVMGSVFGGVGQLKDVATGKVKADNKLYADQQAMIQKVEGGKDLLKGVLDQAGQLDPKSKVVSMIQSSAELAKAQTELMPLISEAYLAGDTGRADALRAKLLQFQAYDYFDKGLANHLLDTVDALANNKEQAIAAFGENYQSKINETKKVIQESKEVYDTYVPMAPIGSEKILYQNILNRNNLSKALTKAKQDQGKARVAYMQELNNYNPAFQGLDYQLEGSAVENEFKAQNPLVLQELEKANNQVEILSTSYKENLKQFSDIQAGKYFVKQEEVKQAQAKEVEKQEAKLTKEQEIANNTKAQQAQSLANDIQDESKPEVTKDAVNQQLDEKIAEIDSQVANEEITPEEAEVEKAKIEEIKAEVETKTTPIVEEGLTPEKRVNGLVFKLKGGVTAAWDSTTRKFIFSKSLSAKSFLKKAQELFEKKGLAQTWWNNILTKEERTSALEQIKEISQLSQDDNIDDFISESIGSIKFTPSIVKGNLSDISLSKWTSVNGKPLDQFVKENLIYDLQEQGVTIDEQQGMDMVLDYISRNPNRTKVKKDTSEYDRLSNQFIAQFGVPYQVVSSIATEQDVVEDVTEEDVISNEAFFEGLNGGFDLEDSFDDILPFSDTDLDYSENPFLDYDNLPDNENGVLGNNEPIMEIPEDTVTEEVIYTEVKEGVNDVFNSNPELSNIGTLQQYSQYLDTIFPDSKVKDIVYHGTEREKFEHVDIAKSKWGGKSFYVTSNKNYAESYTGNSGSIISILINVKNIKRTPDSYAAQPYNKEQLQKELDDIDSDKIKLSYFGERGLEITIVNTEKEADDFIQRNSGWEIATVEDLQEYKKQLKKELTESPYDTILTNVEGGGDIIFAVFEPEQIHILGSKQDIEGFKKFVSSYASSSISKPSKKLVYVPTSISVKTVSSKDNALTGEASNEGGEGGADIDKVQASNVLDNSENSVQKGTNLFITPTEVLGQKAYQFTTEDGRLVGYLHKPEYVRTSRVAVEKLTDEEREAELARQTEELKGMWANLDTHFSATSEPYRTVVTDKTPGNINRTPSDDKIKSEILSDERVVVVPVTFLKNDNRVVLQLNNREINEYLEPLGGILDEQSYEILTSAKDHAGKHVILVPTAARLGNKIVYNFAFANKTVLNDNPNVRNLVKTVIANYLKGEGSVADQAFVSDILNIDIEFKLSTNQNRIVTVPIKETGKKALVTPENMGAIENVGIRLPLPYAHDDIITVAGQEFIPQQFIGGTLKSNLNYSTLIDGTKSYVHNPVISFEPIVLSSSVVPAIEEVKPVKKEKPPVKKDIYNSPKDVEENPLLSLDKLSTEKGFNIIKKQEIVKAISVLLFRFITKKGTDNSVSDVLKGLKEDLVDSRDLHEYFVENGLEQEDIDNGFLDNIEHNQSVVDNLNYTLENWEVLSDNALNLLKETGYNLKKDTKDLSTAEIKPNPEEISDASIQNDTADTVDSTLVDKPEEASSSKYDKMMFEESMYEVSSAFVRTWLNSIGSGKKSVIGGVDSYGGKKLFGELLNIFKDRVYNEDDFKAIIAKEGVSKPQFADLAKKFDTLEPHYKVQILNSLDVTKANFRAVNPKGVFDSNRNTKEIQLKEMVNQGLQSLFNEGVGGQPNTLSEYGKLYFAELNSLMENADKDKDLPNDDVINVLGKIGIPINTEVLSRLKKDNKAFGVKLYKDLLYNITKGQSLQTLEEVKMSDQLYFNLVGAPNAGIKKNLQEYIIESDGDSIVTVEGKKVYPFGIHHATSKLWANLKDRVKGSDLVKNLLSVPFISENTWLKSKTFGQIIYMDGAGVLTAEERKINQQLEEDIEKDQKAGRTPDWARIKEMMKKPKNKTYANMTTEEKLMAKFEFFTRSTASNGTYSYWSSAKSDKSVVLGIEAPKVTSGFELAVAKVIAAEAKRINQFAKLPKESGVNGSVFYLFPWLNDMSELFTQTINGKEVDEKFLQPGYTKLLGYARKAINTEIKTVTETLVKSGVKITDETKKRVEEFVTSEIVNNYNFLSLVSGDPAYFAKLNKDGSVNIPKTMANLFKRLTRDIATAKRGRGDYKQLKVITFTEPKGDHKTSKNIEQLEALLGSQQTEKGLNKKGEMEYDTFGYRKVEAADAQGYCTIKEYWDLMYGDGLISLEKRDALCKIFDDHFKVAKSVEGLIYSEADLEGILIKPRKPVTIGNKFTVVGKDSSGKDIGVNRPIYIKYSIFPLLPQLLHADSPLIKLCDFMENNGVHRAVAESGFKVGSAKPVNIEAETITATEDQFTVVDREMDGNQLDIPYDETKEAILQGTQLLKLVFDGVADSELKEVFYKNQEALLDKMNSDYIAKMGISEVNKKYQITDMEKFKKELAAALSDSFENPNDKVSFETVDDKFKLPLFFNKLGPKIESTLIQGFKKKVLKSKLAGRSFVLVSEYLFKGNTTTIATTPSYDPEKGLLPARLMKGDRLATAEEIKAHYNNSTENPLTVAPAQVMIAWNFKDENGNLLKMSDYVKDGKLDMDKIDPKMLKMIGYRIPTQGHNSMSVCEVVGFLPPYMGDTIVAPKDWTVQMGSDFDIDKVFMHFRYGKVDKAGKIVAQLDGDNGLKNTIYNNYEAVLSKTEVFKKMMIPLDFGRLPDIVKELQKIDRFKESQGSILSPVTQVNNYETGTAGKVGVGMSSLLSVFASIIQGKGLTVREGLSIKVGDRIIDLKDLSSPNQLLDPTKSKNMVISAFQSASVDNIKELLVKTINYNSDTHPLLISMSLLGLDEEWISYMMVQDIKPLKIAFENYKGFEPKPLTLELMKQAVSNPTSLTTYEMANLYHHYDSFKLLGDEISKLSGLVNITTNGFGTYFEDINYLQESSNILLNARSLEKEGMTKLIQDGFWGKGWKFMQNTQDVIGQLFPVRSSLYKTIMAYGNSEEFIKYPTKEYKKALKNFVKAYMMSDLSMFGGSVTEQRQRLFYGDNSLAHRASVLKAENPKNSFLQSLSFSFSNDGIKPNLVKYIGKGLTVTEKFLWQQQLKEMFYSENPIEAEFAKDFIIYQYAAGGIQVPTSAISMLPSDLTRLMKLDEDVSKIDWTEATTDVINDILTQFIQHNSGKFKFEKEAPGTKGFFGMMEVVKNANSSSKEAEVFHEPTRSLNNVLNELAEGEFASIIKDLGDIEPTDVLRVDSSEINGNAGEYNRSTGLILVANDISKEEQEKVIIHETIHHVLSNTVKEYNKHKAGQAHKLTPEGIVAMRRMERLYTVAQENFAKKGGPKRLENTLKNLDEFISDMVSEKEVQKWSNDIEVSGESLWSKFKKLATNILQSLGLVKVKEGSLLEAFLDTYLEVKENRVVGNNSTPVEKEPLTTKEIAELNKGRKVRVTFDSLRYNNTFDAVVTGEIFVVSKSFKKNDITGEISDYVEIAHLELRTNTGKLITASVYEIEGLIKESKLNSPKKTSKYNKTTVLAKVGKMNPDLKREFLQHISEATKLNPINIGYLNDTDFDNYYFPSYKARGDANPTKIVRKANIDKMGEYFAAKEKSDREKSYTQKDISEIIKDVANSDRPLAGLAKHLVKYADLVKPKIEFTTDLRLPNHATESGFGDKAEGLYNNRTNVISINLGVNHPKGLEYTILHEYMHALTAHEIRRGGPKVDALKDLYEVAKDKLKNKELHTNTRYALLDWDEFIVGIFTNGMFIKELQSLPATGVKYKNLWENVLDSLLNILGITKKDSFYEEAFALATNIVEDHISYEEMMKRQEEFSNFVEDQFEESQFSAGDTMQSMEDFFNNCK